jgi:hypothetical protein
VGQILFFLLGISAAAAVGMCGRQWGCISSAGCSTLRIQWCGCNAVSVYVFRLHSDIFQPACMLPEYSANGNFPPLPIQKIRASESRTNIHQLKRRNTERVTVSPTLVLSPDLGNKLTSNSSSSDEWDPAGSWTIIYRHCLRSISSHTPRFKQSGQDPDLVRLTVHLATAKVHTMQGSPHYFFSF